MVQQPVLRVLDADATDEEIAAIVAAVTLVASAAAAASPDDTLHEWVRGSRLSARGAGLQRGPWRLSGRLARRAHV